jgi:hypothetical protein
MAHIIAAGITATLAAVAGTSRLCRTYMPDHAPAHPITTPTVQKCAVAAAPTTNHARKPPSGKSTGFSIKSSALYRLSSDDDEDCGSDMHSFWSNVFCLVPPRSWSGWRVGSLGEYTGWGVAGSGVRGSSTIVSRDRREKSPYHAMGSSSPSLSPWPIGVMDVAIVGVVLLFKLKDRWGLPRSSTSSRCIDEWFAIWRVWCWDQTVGCCWRDTSAEIIHRGARLQFKIGAGASLLLQSRVVNSSSGWSSRCQSSPPSEKIMACRLRTRDDD